MSKSNENQKSKPIETSKKLLWVTYILFLATLIVGVICIFKDKDTSLFIYAIPSTGGVFGATVTFYLNKAKMENIFKGKEEFLKYKLDLLKEQPESSKICIEDELNDMDSVLNNYIDSETQDAVNEKFNVNNF